MNSLTDELFDRASSALGYLARAALQRAIDAAKREAANAVTNQAAGVAVKLALFTYVLGKLAHGTANVVADSYRGPSARPLTRAESQVVAWAFGQQPVSPGQVRFVPGYGDNKVALAAFINGNPAITIGNTVYVEPGKYREVGGADLTNSSDGMNLLLHEYMHVVQYARFGFARFGARYGVELAAAGGDANALYAYDKRDKHFENESIEGQAALVGDFGGQLASAPDQRNAALIRQLRSKLRGTGLLGQ